MRASEYPSWTFSNEDTVSYAAFNINQTDGENFNISFFLRSLKPSGLLLQLRRGRRAYLTLYLREGTLVFNSPPTTLFSNGTYITRGQRELVTVVVRQGQVGFSQGGTQLSLGGGEDGAGGRGVHGGSATGGVHCPPGEVTSKAAYRTSLWTICTCTLTSQRRSATPTKRSSATSQKKLRTCWMAVSVMRHAR